MCVLCLNNPPLNAIGFELLEQLCSAFSRANTDKDVRGIIVTGDDDHFSAGADVNIFKRIATSLVEQGCLGQKTGAGVYKYEKGDYTPQDDVAIVLGTGFPNFRGGVLKYAYDLGIDNVICRLESLAERFGERFRLCKLLQNKTGV